MSELTLQLPSYVFENNIDRLIICLSQAEADGVESVVVDFSAVKYYMPAGIVLILTAVRAWVAQGRRVLFRGHKGNEAFRYLQRIDFFRHVGLFLDEDFNRQPHGNAFVPIKEIQQTSGDATSTIAADLARCLVDAEDPTDPLFLLAQYGVGEIVSNCRQHSGSLGFASAQYAAARDMARIAVADRGMGIRQSFLETDSPHVHAGMTDEEAIAKAVEGEVSSKTHLPNPPYGQTANKGVGLTMIRSMVGQTLGHLYIASGTGWFYQDGANEPRTGTFASGVATPGTLVSAGFRRDQIADFATLLQTAWGGGELTIEQNDDNLFSK